MNKSLMIEAGFTKEVEAVEARKCPFCTKEIKFNTFRNPISIREYEISGLCQKCQDKTFGKD